MKKLLMILSVVAVICSMTVSTFAMSYPSDLPALPTSHQGTVHHVVYTSSSSNANKYLLVFHGVEGYTLTATHNGSGYATFRTNMDGVSWSQYSSQNGVGSWQLMNSSTVDGQMFTVQVADKPENFFYSTVDFKLASGDLFFPLPPVPLAEEVLNLAGETMQVETIPALAGSMNILVPCGVGLVALLVVLKLFGKLSLIYRS